MFDQSLDLLSHPRYLGSHKVVDGLLRDFVAAVMNSESEEDMLRATEKSANIFAGLDANYPTIPGWAQADKLGRDLAQFMGVDDQQSFYDEVRTAFLVFATMLMQAVVDNEGDEDAQKAAFDHLLSMFAGVLLGAGAMAVAE